MFQKLCEGLKASNGACRSANCLVFTAGVLFVARRPIGGNRSGHARGHSQLNVILSHSEKTVKHKMKFVSSKNVQCPYTKLSSILRHIRPTPLQIGPDGT
jgi:hypothetical protein